MPTAAKILPFVSPNDRDELDDGHVQPLEAEIPLAIAEQRIQEAWWALEEAGIRQMKPRELQLLEEAYAQALRQYEAKSPEDCGGAEGTPHLLCATRISHVR